MSESRELLTYPRDHVVALVDSDEAAEAAVAELVAGGIDRGDVMVLSGAEGADELDPSGKGHGLAGRLHRIAEWMGGERELLETSAAHLRDGGVSVCVPADEEHKADVARILKGHGAHHIVHYARNHWTDLGP